MNFGFNEEQEQLRAQVRRFLDHRCPIEEVRRVMAAPEGFSRELWGEVAALGWLGLTVPEAYGGTGLQWIDLVVVLEETGRSLFPSPLISNALATSAIVEYGSEAQKSRWLPLMARGERIGTLAILEADAMMPAGGTGLRGVPDGDGFTLTGEKRFVNDPEAADIFIVSFRRGDGADDVGLAVVAADNAGVVAKHYPMIDATKRQGIVTFAGVRVGADEILDCAGGVSAAITRLFDAGAIAVTAEMAGAVDAAIRMTVEYVNQRVQFDRPIGQFQGVKHPLAEMYVDLESFKSLLYYAAWSYDHSREEVSRYASLAKAYATESFVRTGVDSIQLHGAIGFSTACDIQLYFKRSKWARPAYGDAATHYERALALRGV